jgi:hypothetical protein
MPIFFRGFSLPVLCFSCVSGAHPWFILPLVWFLCVDFEFFFIVCGLLQVTPSIVLKLSDQMLEFS